MCCLVCVLKFARFALVRWSREKGSLEMCVCMTVLLLLYKLYDSSNLAGARDDCGGATSVKTSTRMRSTYCILSKVADVANEGAPASSLHNLSAVSRFVQNSRSFRF